MSDPSPADTDREHQDRHGDDVVGGEDVAAGVPRTGEGRSPEEGGARSGDGDSDHYDEAWGGEH